MDSLEILKKFKTISPDPAYSEKSKRAILATVPKERWTFGRGLAHILEAGIAVSLVSFFIFVITGQFVNTPYVAPVQFSVINPQALKAEAQAVDIQIQLADVAYQASTSTVNETTPQAAVGTSTSIQHGFAAALKAMGEPSATSSAGAGTQSASATSSATISVDEALKALSE